MHYYPKDTGERADTDLNLAHLPRRAYGKDADLIKVSELPPGALMQSRANLNPLF
jgi:hypothetical protein